MAINFSQDVYAHTYAVFARPVTFTPKVSQPAQPAYVGRGIYTTQPTDIEMESTAIFSDAVTILDVLESEFVVVPLQGDELFIPEHIGIPAAGNFEVFDVDTNGGGETTLALRKIVVSKP